MIDGYYYLHENGNLIFKPKSEDVVADLRDSPFVRQFWPLDANNREHAWRILVEARALGANADRVAELAKLWHCDDKDAAIYAERVGVTLQMDGNQWCATPPGFINLQESAAGFGATALEAMAELCKALGYKASKLWGHEFSSLLCSSMQGGAA